MYKSFLKWPGGKSRVLEDITPYFSNSNSDTFVEPFAGSSVVSINFSRFYDTIIINDINQDLINMFRVISELDSLRLFFDKLENHFQNHNEGYYYEIRDKFNQKEESDLDLAAMFIYINRHCYNGLVRYNQDGEFNSPIGDYDSPYFPRKEIFDFYKVINSNDFEFWNKDFREVFDLLKGKEDIYCDPPYIPLEAGSEFTDYHTDGFGFQEQKDLRDCCLDFDGGVVISNSGSDLSYELYKDFKIEELDVNRFIGSEEDSREKVSEILASKSLRKNDTSKQFFEL